MSDYCAVIEVELQNNDARQNLFIWPHSIAREPEPQLTDALARITAWCKHVVLPTFDGYFSIVQLNWKAMRVTRRHGFIIISHNTAIRFSAFKPRTCFIAEYMAIWTLLSSRSTLPTPRLCFNCRMNLQTLGNSQLYHPKPMLPHDTFAFCSHFEATNGLINMTVCNPHVPSSNI